MCAGSHAAEAEESTKALPVAQRRAAAGDLERRYQRATGYTLEQWTGRINRVVSLLPKELAEAEMLRVARVHFPGQNDLALKDVCHRARKAGSFLKPLADVASLAEWKSSQRGGNGRLSRADIDSAASEVLPQTVAQASEPEDGGAEVQSTATPGNRPRKRAAETVQELCSGLAGGDRGGSEDAPGSGARTDASFGRNFGLRLGGKTVEKMPPLKKRLLVFTEMGTRFCRSSSGQVDTLSGQTNYAEKYTSC